MVFEDGYQILGFIGGCMFPLATAAQTYKAFASKSTEDISYGWQLVYALAEVLYCIYSFHFRLWVIFGPCAAELLLLVVMVIAKIYFDNFYEGNKRTGASARLKAAQSLSSNSLDRKDEEKQI